MPTFTAPDGTELAYRVLGDGAPVVCLPGGPMQESVYLGNLGGLSGYRQLIMVDLRGTGRSATPVDPGSYRCDRLVHDVEALRDNLGLDRVDLLGHSAGANLAALYAARKPARIGKLALITPSTMAVGITISAEMRREVVRLRTGEAWFPAASAAFEAIQAGAGTDEDWAAIAPFRYGRWDATAQAHRAAEDGQRNDHAARAFGAEGAFDPQATRAALAGLGAPVLLLAGEFDVNTPPSAASEFAAMFPSAQVVVQPGAGHFPWLEDADRFVAAVSTFLG